MRFIMNIVKKVLNVLGIIIAWFLSFAIIVLLFASPILMSAFSVAKPEQIIDSLQNIELRDAVLAMDAIDSDNEQLVQLLSTNAAQEMYNAYISGMIGIFDPTQEQNPLTGEKIAQIVHDNIDELYTIVCETVPEISGLPVEEGKQQVETMFTQSISEVIVQLPTPEAIRQEMIGADPAVQAAMDVICNTDIIKLSFVIEIVVLSALIFVCRLPGFRGIRWLSVDLFVAFGLAVVPCVAVAIAPGVLTMLAEGNVLASMMIQEFWGVFSVGVYVRTAVLLVSAIVLLVLYKVVKKAIANNKRTIVAEPSPEEAT